MIYKVLGVTGAILLNAIGYLNNLPMLMGIACVGLLIISCIPTLKAGKI